MTERKVVDQIITNAQSIREDDSRMDYEFVLANLNTIRAQAIRDYVVKFKRVSPIWMQTIDLKFDKNLQEDVGDSACITKYLVPEYIQLDGTMDGMLFIGNSDNKSFRRIKTRGELATMKKHKLLNPANGRYIGAMTDGTTVELHSDKKIKSLSISAILFNPNDDPKYNRDSDNYPVSGDLIPMMTDVAMKLYFNRVTGLAVDMASNKNDSAQQPQPRR